MPAVAEWLTTAHFHFSFGLWAIVQVVALYQQFRNRSLSKRCGRRRHVLNPKDLNTFGRLSNLPSLAKSLEVVLSNCIQLLAKHFLPPPPPHTHTQTYTRTHTHTHTHTHIHTLSLSVSLSVSVSVSVSLSLSLSLSLTLSPSAPWNVLFGSFGRESSRSKPHYDY